MASLKGQRQLGQTDKLLSASSARLSSGLRITSASDDPAGLSIADTLRASTVVAVQGTRNLNDAVSMFNIADSAVSNLKQLNERMSELATQASNGVLSVSQRKALDNEYAALGKEYNRIIDTTSFNGVSLFSSSVRQVDFQGGGSSLALGFGAQQTVGTATFTATDLGAYGRPSLLDVDGDGDNDIVAGTGAALRVFLNNGNGTFVAGRTFAAGIGGAADVTNVGDVNGDGLGDVVVVNSVGVPGVGVLISNGDGSFRAPLVAAPTVAFPQNFESIALADYNGDGKLDLGSNGNGVLIVMQGNGDGTFKEPVQFSGGGQVSAATGDFNEDGNPDLVGGFPTLLLGDGRGGFTYGAIAGLGMSPIGVAIGDFNSDGHQDVAGIDYNGGVNTVSINLGNGDGTFRAALSYDSIAGALDMAAGDFNGDGALDLAAAFLNGELRMWLGNGDGTFRAQTLVDPGGNAGVVAGDINGDNVTDILTGTSATIFTNGTTTDTVALTSRKLGIAGLSDSTLTNMYEAKKAIGATRQNLQLLQTASATLGAYQSRLQYSVSLLSVRAELNQEVESRIRDIDVAAEAADQLRGRILQQAGAAVLAQANKLPQIALGLLTSAG